MAVHIRLQRHGSATRPFFHVVAADHRCARDGRFLEKVGYYDPSTQPSTVNLKGDRIQHWFGIGAQLSSAVAKLVKIEKIELTRTVTKPAK
jgi:small subunit ribosomal protein S16